MRTAFRRPMKADPARCYPSVRLVCCDSCSRFHCGAPPGGNFVVIDASAIALRAGACMLLLERLRETRFSDELPYRPHRPAGTLERPFIASMLRPADVFDGLTA